MDGRFSVQRYGKRCINSIQIELADTICLCQDGESEIECERKRLRLIEDLAFAIINFVRRHAQF
ncbi:hypothetical protein [Nitrosomonas communis]|uniref:hypothetical protein n=1 Tax=Nitrosomonas communis TaxID=44574 RepID=UPI0009428D18|nr:hypothetical protein [Nitrosomonas communis]